MPLAPMTLADKFAALLRGEALPVAPAEGGAAPAHRPARLPAGVSYYYEAASELSSDWILPDGPAIAGFIGADSYMNGGGYLRGMVLIGRYCSIGRRVSIGAGAHSLTGVTTSPRLRGTPARSYSASERAELYRARAGGPVIIESDVWIGDGAVIMPGVRLGAGSVVGANAVVTAGVAPYAIVGGVPARTIGQRFAPDLAGRLLASAWWERPANELAALPAANVHEFLERLGEPAPAPHSRPTYRQSG